MYTMPERASKLLPSLLEAKNLPLESGRAKTMWVWKKMLCITLTFLYGSGLPPSLPVFTYAPNNPIPGWSFWFVTWIMSIHPPKSHQCFSAHMTITDIQGPLGSTIHHVLDSILSLLLTPTTHSVLFSMPLSHTLTHTCLWTTAFVFCVFFFPKMSFPLIFTYLLLFFAIHSLKCHFLREFSSESLKHPFP